MNVVKFMALFHGAFSTVVMEKLGKIRRYHWKERHNISKTALYLVLWK